MEHHPLMGEGADGYEVVFHGKHDVGCAGAIFRAFFFQPGHNFVMKIGGEAPASAEF